jgi:hypothetical protein
VGNAETEGYTIVLGEGATGVMNAVMYALAATSAANETRSVFAQAPYYGNYVAQTWNAMAVDSDLNRHVLQWDEAADVDSESTFEIVTCVAAKRAQRRMVLLRLKRAEAGCRASERARASPPPTSSDAARVLARTCASEHQRERARAHALVRACARSRTREFAHARASTSARSHVALAPGRTPN